jgi:hypothetical protein
MGIVYPSKAVAARWEGALQARLRRAPLEAFLRERSLGPAPAGRSQDTDNLARASVAIVAAGLDLYFHQREDRLAYNQRRVVAHVACLVSLTLAQLISEPELWRNPALVSSAKVLSPWIGLNAAAVVSTTVAREFQKEVATGMSPLDWRISKSACEAVSSNKSTSMSRAAWNIAARLNAETPVAIMAVPERDSRQG